MKRYVIYCEYDNQLHTSYLDLKKSNKTKVAGQNLVFKDERFYLNNEQVVDQSKVVIREYSSKHFFSKGLDILTFGKGENNDFVLQTNSNINIIISLNENKLSIIDNTKVYVNGNLVFKEYTISYGDRIYFLGHEIVYHNDMISFVCFNHVKSKHVEQNTYLSSITEETFDHHRSPRLIHIPPTDEINILDPGAKPTKPTEGLARIVIPPLVMLAGTILISFLMPYNRMYAIVGLMSTFVMLIFSIMTYVDRVKQFKKDTKDRIERYTVYLEMMMQKIADEVEKQKYSANYHLVDVNKLSEMALNYNHRIFEKAPLHHDFLEFRVGVGRIKPSFNIVYEKNIMELHKEDLVVKADDIYDYFDKVEDIPIGIDLLHGPIGYVGRHDLVVEQLQLMLLQLAFFHSYLDVEFVSVFSEEEYDSWHSLRWLPHLRLNNMNVRSMVYHQKGVDQILNSLAQVIKQRENKVKAKDQEKILFSPHYVIVITDEKLIFEHPIYEVIKDDPTKFGVSMVYTNNVTQKLPEFVKTIVEIKNENEAKILMKEGKLINQLVRLDHLSKEYTYETIPRRLAGLNHIIGVKNAIPEKVTFLEMYEVTHVEELDIFTRYNQAAPHKTLAVPLGYRAKDDIVYLNLHEKAHGPHGLVAGTTGSGKSEIVQSYILSLAINYHPYDIAFLLIDYKGGGMANLFKDLPHHLGSITNLDGSQSMRALVSINAELKRRQRIFGENDVNHINQYHKLFKEGLASEPIPHLFIISDEFAELKSEQPDFMKELVSTARIGRSLGVHLILATQKPSGVVDDQIWSNSKFKLALKVQDAGDSNEVLKTPDAANITVPGRAYLQVGNNEIYELFQSAWSGADYVLDEEVTEIVDDRIYKVNNMGQYELISNDLSGLKNTDNKQIITQLEAVIDYIGTEIQATDYQPVSRPWLPPLSNKVSILEMIDYNIDRDWATTNNEIKFNLGIVDLPHLQAQENLEVNLSEDGHFLVYGSPGFGKSSTLQTILMDLSRRINPQYLEYFLLDFGTNSLMPLRKLPCVADLILAEDSEKMGKFETRIRAEIKRRKRLCQEVSAPNIGMYEELTGKKERRIVIALDNYDVVRDSELEDSLEPLLTQLTREGLSIGIHIIISASVQNAFRVTMVTNIKHQMSLYMIDESEVTSIVGRTDYKVDEIEGRGLFKVDDPALIQIYLPSNGEGNVEVLSNLTKEVASLNERYTGIRPKAIPIMPEEIRLDEFIKDRQVQEVLHRQYQVPIGYDYQNVECVSIDFNKVVNFYVAGGTSGSECDTLDYIAQMLITKKCRVSVFDDGMGSLSKYDGIVPYYDNADKINEFCNIFEEELRFKENTEKHFLIIADLGKFSDDVMMFDNVNEAFVNAKGLNVHFIYGHHAEQLMGNSDITRPAERTANGIILHKVSDQSIYNLPIISREPDVVKHDGYHITEGKINLIKVIGDNDD